MNIIKVGIDAGKAKVVCASLASELLDLRRFSKAGELMAFTGLTGREYSRPSAH